MEITKKVLSIMNLLAQRPTGVTEISKQLGIGKSTVSRTLSALENEQWVAQDINTKKYKVSFKMIQLSLSILSRIDLRNISLPYMNELRRLTGETVILNIRVDLERVCIEHHYKRCVVQWNWVKLCHYGLAPPARPY
jgi:DNA-binding IclR family transcriptional regulator